MFKKQRKTAHISSFLIPDFVEIQRKSFSYFLEKGIIKEFSKINPIESEISKLKLLFYPKDYLLILPEYSISDAVIQGRTYSCKLYLPAKLSAQNKIFKTNLRNSSLNPLVKGSKTALRQLSAGLSDLNRSFYFAPPDLSLEEGVKDKRGIAKKGFETLEKEHNCLSVTGTQTSLSWVLVGNLPLMTKRGHFIVNGSPRVLVNQLARSPGVYFQERVIGLSKEKKRIIYADFVSRRGAWLRIQTDKEGDTWARLKKTPKIPFTLFLDGMTACERNPETWTAADKETLLELHEEINPTRRDVSAESGSQFLMQKFKNFRTYDLGTVGRERLNKRFGISIVSQQLTSQDLYFAFQQIQELQNDQIVVDDIDHLKNRRVRAAGELVQGQFETGLYRLEKAILTKMRKPPKEVTPRTLLNTKPLNGTLREFFGSSPLSQYMDQTNPLAEITQKRRISSLGPGGISRETAGMAVRGIHSTHYGRICPIETPEGKNAGLVNSLTIYTRINDDGILETPYYRVLLGQVQKGAGFQYFSAFTEEKYEIRVAPGDVKLSTCHLLPEKWFPVREAGNLQEDFKQINRAGVNYMAISPIQMISIATSLIPFLEHDDANRALMGSNMQRQAVPLLKPERPIVGTGLEALVIAESGHAVQAQTSGYVSSVSSEKISVHTFHPGGSPSLRLPFPNPNKFVFQACDPLVTPFSRGLELDPLITPYPLKEKGLGNKNQILTPVSDQVKQVYSSVCLKNRLVTTTAFSKQRRITRLRKEKLRGVTPLGFSKTDRYQEDETLSYVRDSLKVKITRFKGSQAGFKLTPLRVKRDYYFKLAQPFAYNEPPVKKEQDSYGKEIFNASNFTITPLLPPLLPLLNPNPLAKRVSVVRDKDKIKEVRSKIDDFNQNTYQLIKQLLSHSKSSFLPSLPYPAYKRQQTVNTEGLSQDYLLQNYNRSNQETCLTHVPAVCEGDWIQRGDLLADCSASQFGELALGKNILIAYLPWEGYNFEDAVVISERLVFEDVYTSIHVQKYEIEIGETKFGLETITPKIPGRSLEQTERLNSKGIVKIGTWVKEGDILVGKVSPRGHQSLSPYERLAYDIANVEAATTEDTSLRVPKGVEGRVINYQVFEALNIPLDQQVSGPGRVRVYLAEKRRIQVGDKVAGRHGNKGIVSTILPCQDMPYLPDGTVIDMVLNPLGIPSRMNVGQVFECLLGLAGAQLGQQFKITPFDEIYGSEASRSLVYLKLYQARLRTNQDWLFNLRFPGKSAIFDGRTGLVLDQWVTVGYAYILKLVHLVDEKIHARSTGPYSLVTKQPLGGRSKHGGQRLGEMEVWALEGFGAAYILQEMLTSKSDDIVGREQIVRSILFKERMSLGNPEAFKVLVRELQSLCLDVGVYAISPDRFQREVIDVGVIP